MTFLPMCWVILIISQTFFILLGHDPLTSGICHCTTPKGTSHAVKKSIKKKILYPKPLIKHADLHNLFFCFAVIDKIELK